MRNSQTDIPVLTCAAARLENGSYRIAIGARPLKAVLFELPAKAGVSAQELAQNFADEVKQKLSLAPICAAMPSTAAIWQAF